MPGLLAWIGSALASFVGFSAAHIGRRAAQKIAVGIVMVASVAAMVVAISALVSGFTAVLPGAVVTGASWVVPSNTNACLGVMIGARITRYVYDWNYFLLISRV